MPIAVNQIEFHPWFQRPNLVEYCRETNTVVEAAAPLARTEVFEDDIVRDLADRYDKHLAQIVLKWAIERGIVVLPKSSSPEHVRANFDLFDWSLTDDDLAALDDCDRDHPVYDHPARDWSDDVYGIKQ